MSRRLLVALAALVALAIVLAEVLLQPAADDRWHLWLIVAGPAVLAAALTPLLARWVAGRASVAGVALTVALCSLALGTVSSSAASNAMFVSSHDYRLFLVVLVVSSGISLIVGGHLTRPLARDLRRLGHVATAVAEGDLSARTGITRADEVGATAQAIDTMVEALDRADTERTRLAAARQHLFTSIGHDLRTPLSAMRAAVESIEDGVSTDPRQTLAVLAAQLRAMDAMLNQLIEFSRLESSPVTTVVERVSLTELADECLEALAPLATPRRIRLRLRADGPAIVTGSPLDLSRVVRNLVDNAIRHSPDDAEVSIDVGTDAHQVRLSVLDRGEGFPNEFREQAFEPFQRADPSRNARTGNAGLGLAIVRAIVHSHGGTISLGDGPGGAVHVLLPASPARSATVPTPASSIGALP
jgi:signal transduction histidine kinase